MAVVPYTAACGVAHYVALLHVVWRTMSHCCMWCGVPCRTAACGVTHCGTLLHAVWRNISHCCMRCDALLHAVCRTASCAVTHCFMRCDALLHAVWRTAAI